MVASEVGETTNERSELEGRPFFRGYHSSSAEDLVDVVGRQDAFGPVEQLIAASV
jgi:hypothetical protein